MHLDFHAGSAASKRDARLSKQGASGLVHFSDPHLRRGLCNRSAHTPFYHARQPGSNHRQTVR